jgi:hypothetical protein
LDDTEHPTERTETVSLYRIRLRDCSTTTVDADEITDRPSGALWVLAAHEPDRGRSHMPKLKPVLILPRGEWLAVWPADSPSPFAPADTDDAGSEPEPRLLVQAAIDDPLGRRDAIQARLAALGTEHDVD